MRLTGLVLLSAFSGALTTFSIPPYGYWWLSIVTLTALAFSLSQVKSNKMSFLMALAFGLGYYATGVSWVYVSIHEFGMAPVVLAILLTGLFVIAMASFMAAPFYLLGYFSNTQWRLLIGFPLLWCLSEWLRGWLFTGFPWLYIGYAHIESPLVGWAPIGGVLLVGLLSAVTSSVLCGLFSKQLKDNQKVLTGILVVILWAEGNALSSEEWTVPAGEPISVGLIQPNVSLWEKWSSEARQPIMNKLLTLSEPLWENDWVVWPEAAIPDIYFRAEDFINEVDTLAEKTQTSVFSGVLYDDREQQKFFNSFIGLGDAEGIYFKQRLVPFGEYVPMEQWLRGIINFFDLPNSFIYPGGSQQANITSQDYSVATAICYEIVYPSLVATQAKTANAIITVSNDAWFGQSIGPLQHFHMARMRAIETGRYIIRSTNNGVSAIIEADGSIQEQSEQFIATYLAGTVIPMEGNTPYLIWKDGLVIIIMLLLLTGLIYLDRNVKTKVQ